MILHDLKELIYKKCTTYGNTVKDPWNLSTKSLIKVVNTNKVTHYPDVSRSVTIRYSSKRKKGYTESKYIRFEIYRCYEIYTFIVNDTPNKDLIEIE